MHVRKETQLDFRAVHALNLVAFPTPAEANLVDQLREQVSPCISLVAILDETLVGHIMFSPVTLAGDLERKVMGLAPMAVLPAHQRTGIGTALVLEGLAACRATGWGAVVVLGHPEFYPRFGFLPGSEFGIRSEYDVPDEVFMALELVPDALKGARGALRYHEVFSTL